MSLIRRALIALRQWWHRDILDRQREVASKVETVLAYLEEARMLQRHAKEANNRLEIGAFVPSDEDAARLERQHQVAEHRFLSARQPTTSAVWPSGRIPDPRR